MRCEPLGLLSSFNNYSFIYIYFRLALSIILGIIVPLVSLAVIFSIFMHLKYVPLYRKGMKIPFNVSNISRKKYYHLNDLFCNVAHNTRKVFEKSIWNNGSKTSTCINTNMIMIIIPFLWRRGCILFYPSVSVCP